MPAPVAHPYDFDPTYGYTPEEALLFPCFRGLSRSARPPISTDPVWHVLHDIDRRDRYIIGGCVEDLWRRYRPCWICFPTLTVMWAIPASALAAASAPWPFPGTPASVAAILLLPTFGHYPLRLGLPSVGSLAAVRAYQQRRGADVLDVLKYYDAACRVAPIAAATGARWPPCSCDESPMLRHRRGTRRGCACSPVIHVRCEETIMARSLMPSLFSETPAGRLPDPFGALQREFNRLFQDAFAGFTAPLAGGETALSPRINICETDQDFRIDAELPGVPEESVDVTLSEDILTIRGEKKAERSEKQENYHLMERTCGSFVRSIRLPFAVKPEDVQASMYNGVLTLTLPKTAAQQRLHHIQISRAATLPAGQGTSAQGSQAKH